MLNVDDRRRHRRVAAFGSIMCPIGVMIDGVAQVLHVDFLDIVGRAILVVGVLIISTTDVDLDMLISNNHFIGDVLALFSCVGGISFFISNNYSPWFLASDNSVAPTSPTCLPEYARGY